MRKVQVLFGMALVALVASSTQAAIPLGPGAGDSIISLIYNPADGNLKLDAAGKTVSTIQITSAGKYFTASRPSQADGSFDVYKPEKFFLLKPDGIGDTDFGKALPAGLDGNMLSGDLTVSGSLKPSGKLEGVNLNIVPEPTSLGLLGLGVLSLLGFRRK